VTNPGEAVWGNCPPKRLWRLFDINASLVGAYRSTKIDLKYSELNNALHFVELQHFQARLYPASIIGCYQQCYSFVIILVLRYFFSFPRDKCPVLNSVANLVNGFNC